MMSKLGLRTAAESAHPLPFDAARCTMDALIHFVSTKRPNLSSPPKGGRIEEDDPAACRYPHIPAGFLPPVASAEEASQLSVFERSLIQRPMTMDPSSIWLLFRGVHTCFTHFDLRTQRSLDAIDAQWRVWHEVLDGHQRGRPDDGIIFFRTSIAESHVDEVGSVMELRAAVKKRSPALQCRFVLALHDVKLPDRSSSAAAAAAPLASPSPDVQIWGLPFDDRVVKAQGSDAPLLARTHDGYETIMSQCATDEGWDEALRRMPSGAGDGRFKRLQSVPGAGQELCCVAGVPAFLSTCVGFGSTIGEAIGACPGCGVSSWPPHVVLLPQKPSGGLARRVTAGTGNDLLPWTDDENDKLITTFATAQMDIVAAVEAHANGHHRTAATTLSQLRVLLGSGTPSS